MLPEEYMRKTIFLFRSNLATSEQWEEMGKAMWYSRNKTPETQNEIINPKGIGDEETVD